MQTDIREIYAASTRPAAEAAIDVFAEKYGAKYEKAGRCLTKDREALLAFFDFPAEHWDHLRTSDPIESVFATVRHRTVRTKGALSATTAKLMVFKLERGDQADFKQRIGASTGRACVMAIAALTFCCVAMAVVSARPASFATVELHHHPGHDLGEVANRSHLARPLRFADL